ncbi:DUF456 domain-containing protein [Neotamlana laminarinivorans]|uniref:DUF456 domain-containing protein n=1 Tax=Neotamlana laminarinivorans TaxID=2883124 RepID=A0A9X1I212_9FLAO|nr:DUF456 domain-containing protein [Tamlana laminarinivorans]MCB4799761.1 DUF456 domain-containing protein [Tamlana laminarinivorans]
MEITLLIISLLLMFLGVLGSFLPVLPGPITSWLGLFVINFTDSVNLSSTFLITTGLIALIIYVLDYIIPALGTKRFGGSKYGVIGTTVGLIVGLIAPIPAGIIVGPFIGALLGELFNKSDTKTATRAAFGSFLGFITSTFLKFIVAIIYFGLFIGIVWEYRKVIFSY